jgi:tRNA nucleotidyltransferase (CCA-adding enzyme)
MNKIFEIFESNNYSIKLVGGCVRDLFMKNTPKDFDFATNALPNQVIELANKNNIHVIPTGLQHGTVTWVIDNIPYEITTLRVDNDCDGRHANVSFTEDWQVDAERRDFTFNAMSMDKDGNIFDYFNGCEDLKNGVIRFVGDTDKRIKEDYLRILRAFRFAARYNFKIIDKEIIAANVSGLKKISKERIWSEFVKIFSSNSWFSIAKEMNDCGIFEIFDLNFKENNTLSKGALFRMSCVFSEKDIPKKFKASVDENKEYNFFVNLDKNWETPHAIRVFRSRGISDNWLLNAVVNNHEIFDETIFEFPLNGEMLISRGMKPGIEMGNFLKNARKEWEDSFFSKSF